MYMKDCIICLFVYSVESAPNTNFMSCFSVCSMMSFVNPFIDMHVHIRGAIQK